MDTSTQLDEWYDSLDPLKVDLVGDFAGKELFAIHGEALMLHCISQAQVDFGSESILFRSSPHSIQCEASHRV